MSADFLWGEVMGMRNRLAHGYDKINYITVYEVATTEMKPLKAEVAKLRSHLKKKFKTK